jgi:hypothetical protein
MLIDFDVEFALGRIRSRTTAENMARAFGDEYVTKPELDSKHDLQCEAKAALALVLGG